MGTLLGKQIVLQEINLLITNIERPTQQLLSKFQSVQLSSPHRKKWVLFPVPSPEILQAYQLLSAILKGRNPHSQVFEESFLI